MKKLFLVLVSVLLLTGVAHSAELGQAITADYSAQNQGRAVVTDSSAIIKVWNESGTSLSSPLLGVSASNVIKLYPAASSGNGITIDCRDTAYDTVGEVVDYINTNFASDSTIKFNAIVGRDGYRDMATSQILAANVEAIGNTKATGAEVENANSRVLSAGVEAVDGVTPRIKSLISSIPISNTNAYGIELAIYDGNTKVWRKFIEKSPYNTSADFGNSANTITISPESKGISATKGNGIVAVATIKDANVDSDTPAKSVMGITIVYDKLRD